MPRAKGQRTPYKTPIDQLKAALRAQITKQVHRSVAQKLASLKRSVASYEEKFSKKGENNAKS